MTVDLVWSVGLAFAGLAVGSFLNVCIHRLPRGESVVAPSSRCPSCGRLLSWVENVPVLSYLALRGRCRACRAPIGVAYPLVEIATAGLFALAYVRLGWQPLLAVRLTFIAAMIVLFTTDLQHRLLPNAVTIPGIAAGLASSVFLEPGWRSALAGAGIGGVGLWLVGEAYYWWRGEEGLGRGDVKMLAMIGAFLGWPLMLLTLFVASVAGSAVGVGMLVLGLGDRRYALPLGSFLAVAAIVAAAAGEPIVAWYWSMRSR